MKVNFRNPIMHRSKYNLEKKKNFTFCESRKECYFLNVNKLPDILSKPTIYKSRVYSFYHWLFIEHP